MAEPTREPWELYEPPPPSSDLVQRIVAAAEAEGRANGPGRDATRPAPKRAGGRGMRLLAAAAAVLLVLGGGLLLLLLRRPPATPGPAPRAEQVMVSRHARQLLLGSRAVATAQPGARLSVGPAAGGGVSVVQDSGRVSYRVARGEPLQVRFPGGFARVLGTHFDLEVTPMKTSVRRGASAAAAAAAVVLSVYSGRVLLGNETESVELQPGERGELRPQQPIQRRPLALSQPGAKRPAAAPRPWARRMRSREARESLLRLLRSARDRRSSPRQHPPGNAPGPRPTLSALPAAERGTLAKEYIQQAVRAAKPLVRECYELALHERAGLQGKLSLRFTIIADPDLGGLVEQVEVVGQSALARQPTLKECLEQTIYSLEFPAPKGGGKVLVTYPFRFSSGPPSPVPGAR